MVLGDTDKISIKNVFATVDLCAQYNKSESSGCVTLLISDIRTADYRLMNSDGNV